MSALSNNIEQAKQIFLNIAQNVGPRSSQVLKQFDQSVTQREQQLRDQEKAYLLKLAELDNLQEELEEKIGRQGQQREIQESVERLEQRRNVLKMTVKKLESRESQLMGKVQLYETEISHLKNREQEYAEKEKEIEKAHSLVLQERDSQQDVAFQAFVQKELSRYAAGLGISDPHTEIMSKIEMAKTYLRNGRVNEARQSYGQIGQIYETLSLDVPEKKRIYYAILELKTDIELASMS